MSSPSGSNLSAGDLQALGQERKRALGGQTCAGGTPVDASVSVVLLGQGMEGGQCLVLLGFGFQHSLLC